jgi:hypothetical protein
MPTSIAPSIVLGTLSGMAEDSDTKVRENRLRRMAERQGLRLVKSRRRDPRAIGYGGYMLTNTDNVAVAGEIDSPRALDLDAVESYLLRAIGHDVELAALAASGVGMPLGMWAGRGDWAALPPAARDRAGARALNELNDAITALVAARDRLATAVVTIVETDSDQAQQ